MACSLPATSSRIRCCSRCMYSSLRRLISWLAARSFPIKRSRISGRSSVTAARSLVFCWIDFSASAGFSATSRRALLIATSTSFCHFSSKALSLPIWFAAAPPSGGGTASLPPSRFRSPFSLGTGGVSSTLAGPLAATTGAPPAFFAATASLTARATRSLGLRLRASPASLSALSRLPPLRALKARSFKPRPPASISCFAVAKLALSTNGRVRPPSTLA